MLPLARVLEETAGNRSKVRILDCYVDRVGMGQVLEQVKEFVRADSPHHIVTVSLRFMSIARKDRAFARILNDADLAVADGMPLVWLSKLVGCPIPGRVTGCDLIHNLVSLAADERYSVYLLGGEPGVAAEAASRLKGLYPSLRVGGTRDGYFTADEEPGVVSAINACRPQFLFVGLGSPKQDFWIHRLMHDLDVPVCIGVGGAFEVVTGRLKRAPAWMQQSGLEWIYRLRQEPRRLWRRYMLEDVPTAFRAGGSALLEALSTRLRPR